MQMFKQFLAMLMVTCLVPSDFRIAAAAGKDATHGSRIQGKVTQLGEGAEVRLSLKSGTQMRGSLESITDSTFNVKERGTGNSRRVLFTEVSELHFVKSKYRTEGQVDPVQVRRVAIELGEGRIVGVRTADGTSLKGRLTKVETDRLTVSRRSAEPTVVPYVQVQELKAKTSNVLPIAIIAGVGLLVLAVVYAYVNSD